MTRMIAVALMIGAGVNLAGFTSSAQAAPRGERPSFDELDANGDGQVTRAEMQAHKQARFAAMDADGDGGLSKAELLANAQARAEKRVDRMLSKLDADQDGILSTDELANSRRERGADRMFERADADGSGGISKDEFDTIKAKMKRRKAAKS